MAYQSGTLDRALAAAVGDDPALVAELRDAFLDGAAAHLDALRRARDPLAWRAATARLTGLAASFGAHDLMRISQDASEALPGEPAVLEAVAQAMTRLER